MLEQPQNTGAKLSFASTFKWLCLITNNIAGVAAYRIHPATVVSGVVDPTPPGQIEAAYRSEIEVRPVGISRTTAGRIALVIKCANASHGAVRGVGQQGRCKHGGNIPSLKR